MVMIVNTFYIKNNQLNNGKAYISGDDFHHIKNVLRLKKGEEVYICDDNETKYYSKLVDYKDTEAEFEILYKFNNDSELPVDITLYQGLPKQDKMELIVQKSTELGALTIIPTIMDRCIVKLSEKDFDKKIERWQKIAKEAARTVRKAKNSGAFKPH